jgi:hypothetical protein
MAPAMLIPILKVFIQRVSGNLSAFPQSRDAVVPA